MEQELYRAIGDPYYAKPYIDEEEWRDEPVRHYYVHGGFKGTEKMGQEVKFCIYFPPKEQYEGRFYQYVSPAPESEHESENLRGEADKISFFIKHGAYYVVSNQGGFVLNDGERIYKSNANCAQYGREVAKRVYGYDHRPYGYIFGGSGGSFKTMSCIELTEGVWDGGAPYVLANPMATPNVFAPRVKVMRLLGDEGIAKLVDAMLPGGKGDDNEWMRLYYNDNCIHGDISDEEGSDTAENAWKFISSYLGMLDQSLLDLADWVEKGIEPPRGTDYQIDNGQVVVENAGTRGGLQPAVRAYANGENCVNVKVGEPVHFTAEIEAPVGAVTEAQWDVEKKYSPTRMIKVPVQKMAADGSSAVAEYDHSFEEAGTYFVVVRVASSRNGDPDDICVQCRNLDTVRVIVEG